MAHHFRCGTLFTACDDRARRDHTVIADRGVIAYVGPTAAAPQPAAGDSVVDHARHFVMPGLIDGHTHIGAGNANTEEDVDLYSPLEFRALRMMVNLQRMFDAGYTGVADGATTGRVALSCRNAINAGLFKGPRMVCSGPFIANRTGYPDLYPSWFLNPVAVRTLVHSLDEAIETIRFQAKDGVDFIKICMDGRTRNFDGKVASSFSEADTRRMVEEANRLGKWVKVHAKGAEGATFAARAGARVICHGAALDQRAIDAVLEAGAILCPELTIIHNFTVFTQPTDSINDMTYIGQAEWESTVDSMRRARATGARILAGSDSGFACCPAGEWHALEIKLLVEHVGLTPAEGIRAGTTINGELFEGVAKIGRIEPGYAADLVAFDGNPLADIGVLLDKPKIKGLYMAGERVTTKAPPINMRTETDFAYRMWQKIYDRKRVAAMAAEGRIRAL
ncbi:MAG: amidohydrolase family protein [Alphaproteobacteria bacterium]|nr:amidohydrolase family protein [Alphaproteobacteria bacterium]